MNNRNVQIGVNAELDKIFDLIIRQSHTDFEIEKNDSNFMVYSNGLSPSFSHSRMHSFIISRKPYLALASPCMFELCVLTNADCGIHLFKLIESESESEDE